MTDRSRGIASGSCVLSSGQFHISFTLKHEIVIGGLVSTLCSKM